MSHRELRSYLADFSRAGYSARTTNRHLSAIRDLYKWLVCEDVTKIDPADALASPKVAKSLPATMHLFATTLVDELPLFDQENVRLRFFGDLDALPKETYDVFQEGLDKTSGHTGMVAYFVLLIGGLR